MSHAADYRSLEIWEPEFVTFKSSYERTNELTLEDGMDTWNVYWAKVTQVRVMARTLEANDIDARPGQPLKAICNAYVG